MEALNTTSLVRVKTSSIEIEVSGDREFVDSFRDQILAALMGGSSKATPTIRDVEGQGADSREEPEGSFGEYFSRFPRRMTDVDRILAAGLFVQRSESGKVFKTSQAGELLRDQGIRVANASMCVKQNIAAKRAFSIGKGLFRVSQSGEEHLKQQVGEGVE